MSQSFPSHALYHIYYLLFRPNILLFTTVYTFRDLAMGSPPLLPLCVMKHNFDISVDELLVPEGIMRPVVCASALKWFI